MCGGGGGVKSGQKVGEDGLNQPIFNFGYMAEEVFLL